MRKLIHILKINFDGFYYVSRCKLLVANGPPTYFRRSDNTRVFSVRKDMKKVGNFNYHKTSADV